MSFGPGGGHGNGQPPFPNNGAFVPPGLGAAGLSAMPGVPPMGVIPGAPPPMFPGAMMPSMAPGMGLPMPMAPFNVAYPQGQGPLADRPATVGANGLLAAPKEEEPEEHEGKQFLQLNVAEDVKYGELWADASDGAETVNGTQFAEFMQRATKVSKSQLRTIWQLSDHRNEGALGRVEFFIAMRLLALAQRGAELSVKGLRNFVGIQLLPEVQPRPKPEPQQVVPTPGVDQPANVAAANSVPTGFSWVVPKELIARYDKFFDGLDAERKGIIDGRQGLTFFTKSGLPKSTLRQIWHLADITVDGKLDREEFRQAMHLVTGVKNGRITVEQFPERLHPSTSNWVREIGTEIPNAVENPNSSPPMPALAMHSASPPPPPPPPPLQQAQSSDYSHSEHSSSAVDGTSPVMVGMPGPANLSGGIGSAQLAAPNSQHQPPVVAQMPLLQSTGSGAEEILAELQKQRMESEKVRRDMEVMQAELEKVRLEAAAAATHKAQLDEMAIAKQRAEAEAARAKAELVKAELHRSSKPTPIASPAIEPTASASASMAPAPLTASPLAPPANAGGLSYQSPNTKPQSMGNVRPKIEDDDLWNQPSPERSKPKAPDASGLSKLTMPAASGSNVLGAQEDSSDDDDDDDFWGMGAKPTLGGASKAAGNDTGKQETLDDWLF